MFSESEEEEAVESDSGEKSQLQVFKENIIAVLDIDPEIIESAQVRENLSMNLRDFPTKRERKNLEWNKAREKEKVLSRVPKWAQAVTCPKCGSYMEPIRSHETRFGEGITYQCQDKKYNAYCLTVVSVTTGVYHLMRSGDFLGGDWKWERTISKSPIAVEGVSYKDLDGELESADDIIPSVMPPNPWQKQGARSPVIWNVFWEQILSEKSTTPEDVVEEVAKRRPRDAEGANRQTLERWVDDIPSWITKHTGYQINNVQGRFVITGRVEGDMEKLPYRDEAYRREFGHVDPDEG